MNHLYASIECQMNQEKSNIYTCILLEPKKKNIHNLSNRIEYLEKEIVTHEIWRREKKEKRRKTKKD